MKRRGFTLALLAATAALAALPAQTYAGKWIDAPSTSPLGESAGVGTTPAVAMNASGAEIIAWYEGNKDMARVRQPGGAFGAPVVLNTVPAAGASIGSPNVAIDAAGDVLVTWSEYDGAGHYSFASASAGPGQPLGAGTTIPGSVGAVPKFGAQPLFLSDGTVLIPWATFGGALEVVMRPAGGSFGSPITLASNEVFGLAAAPESGDRALVSWTEENTATTGPEERTTTYTLKSADISAAGSVAGKQTIDTKSSLFTPICNELFVSCTTISLGNVSVAADPAGDGLISYVEASQSSNFLFFSTDVVKAAYRVTGSGFEGPVEFPAVTASLGGLSQSAGLLADGTALVAWEDGQSGTGAIRYAQRLRTGAFPAAGLVVAPGVPDSTPRIVALGESAMLAFTHSKEVLAQEFTASGPQGTPVALSANDAMVLGPVLAGDGGGDALAAWERAGSGGAFKVEAAGYDSGPRLSALAVPASGLTGAALPFGVTASDPLSPVTVQWTFGDGANATGANVTHAYSAPGARTASVTATNAAGMTSATLSGVTQVSSSSPSPPGPGVGQGTSFGASLKIPKQRLRDVLRKGLAVSVSCTGPCKLTLSLQVAAGAAKTLGLLAKAFGLAADAQDGASTAVANDSTLAAKVKRPRHAIRRSVTIGHLSVTLKAAGTKTVHVKLTKAAKRHLRHARRLTLSVVETVGRGSLIKQVVLR